MKIGRNDPCPCGSGKKFKHCCIARRGSAGASQGTVSSDDRIPRFENKLYEQDSEQARYLLDLCAVATREPLKFGDRIFREVVATRYAQGTTDYEEPEGLIIGFHLKAVDVLVSIASLAQAGCLGPVMAATRTFFELFVYQSYLLKEDTPNRVRAYREHYGQQVAFFESEVSRRNNVNTDTSSSVRRPRQSWTGKNLHDLATELGMSKLYVAIYRGGSHIVHSTDIDSYNPIFLQLIRQEIVPLREPHIAANNGLYAAADVISIVRFNMTIPWCMFANTGEYFNLEIPQDARERVSYGRATASDSTTALTTSFSTLQDAFPELIRTG
jgi:Family of unknown function (DUF5677)/SEC-C motif